MTAFRCGTARPEKSSQNLRATSKFLAIEGDPHILGYSVKVAGATWRPGFVHPSCKSRATCGPLVRVNHMPVGEPS